MLSCRGVDGLPKKKFHSVPEGVPESVVITDTLDLHGFFPEQVPEVVDAFLENAASMRLKRLRIVHGKGRSRLKFEVIQVLKSDPRVVAFGDAPPELGGWGATWVEIST